jgi:hypothetical protein
MMVAEMVKLFEVEGNGDKKKEAVLDAVDMAYDEVSKIMELKIPKEFVQAVAERSINIIVNFYNLVGIFKKQSSK